MCLSNRVGQLHFSSFVSGKWNFSNNFCNFLKYSQYWKCISTFSQQNHKCNAKKMKIILWIEMWEKRRLVCTNKCGKWPGTVAVYQMWIQSWLRVPEQERDWHRHGDGQARESQGCPVRGVPWTFIKHSSSQSLSDGPCKTSHGGTLLYCFTRTWSRRIGKGKLGLSFIIHFSFLYFRWRDIVRKLILFTRS